MREKIKKNDFKNDVEKAYAFWYVAKTCFSGRMSSPTFGYDVISCTQNVPGCVSGYLNTLKSLPAIHQRIMTVQIECLDFRECFEKYVSMWSRENAFVYLDPPYVPSTRRKGTKYRHDMTEEDHHDLVELLLKYENNAKFMLSGYPNEIYEKLEKKGWIKASKQVACFSLARTRETGLRGTGTVKSSDCGLKEEVLWMNYEIQPAIFKGISRATPTLFDKTDRAVKKEIIDVKAA